MQKKWQLPINNKKHEFKDNFGLPDFLLQLLYNRGLKSQKQIQEFFNPQYENLHDPFLFNDMQKAVKRILQAVENKEKIMIYGDYDADGVTSAAVLYKTLKILGATVEVFIPHREDDGYGVNKKRIQEFIDKQINLLITVDCGITNIAEVDLANANDLDVIITDHHEQLDVLPKALAIIDPKVKTEKYPCKILAGAAVAYKLAIAILSASKIINDKLSDWGGRQGFAKWLLDLVGIGTIADVVPLFEENRILAKFGLIVLQKSRNIGLQELASACGIDLSAADSFTVGYQIAPRLNAAGRLKHAKDSFNLLVTEDKNQAQKLAQDLQKINTERQQVTDRAMVVARQQIQKQRHNHFLFVYEKSIQAGIVGLVAGRLCDEFYKPIMVMTQVQQKIVGSGRSIAAFNIVESLFANEHLLSRYGGHAQACGFTLEKNKHLPLFKKNILTMAKNSLADFNFVPTIEIDALAKLDDFTFELLDFLEKFEPFGEGNLKPVFLLKNLIITAIDFLGEQAKHLRLMVKEADRVMAQKVIGFNQAEKWGSQLNVGNIIDVIVQARKNHWNGNSSVELKLIDLKISK